MHHDVFGEILYNQDDLGWIGQCALPAFAEYGKEPTENLILAEPDPRFARGVFALTIPDGSGAGPSARQANAFRYLLDNEQQVCLAVMTALVEACNMYGGPIAWLQQRRNSPLWGWLARLVGPEYKTPEDLKSAAQCTGVEVARHAVGDYAYIAFYFATIWGIEMEHGLSVVFHPEKGTSCGDASSIDYISEADNLDEAYEGR